LRLFLVRDARHKPLELPDLYVFTVEELPRPMDGVLVRVASIRVGGPIT